MFLSYDYFSRQIVVVYLLIYDSTLYMSVWHGFLRLFYIHPFSEALSVKNKHRCNGHSDTNKSDWTRDIIRTDIRDLIPVKIDMWLIHRRVSLSHHLYFATDCRSCAAAAAAAHTQSLDRWLPWFPGSHAWVSCSQKQQKKKMLGRKIQSHFHSRKIEVSLRMLTGWTDYTRLRI